MTRAIILGCLAAGGLVVLSYRVGRAAGQLQVRLAQAVEASDPALDLQGCHNCARTVGRLSAELALEAAKVAFLGRALVKHQAHIEYLEGRDEVVTAAEQLLQDGGL